MNLDANKISEIEIFGNEKLFLRVPLEIDYILPWIKCLPCKQNAFSFVFITKIKINTA